MATNEHHLLFVIGRRHESLMCAAGKGRPGSHEDRSFQWVHRKQLPGEARLSRACQLQLQGCSFLCTSPQPDAQPEASLLARRRLRSHSSVSGRLAAELRGRTGWAGAQPGAPAAAQGSEHGAHAGRPLQQPSPRLLQALGRCGCPAPRLQGSHSSCYHIYAFYPCTRKMACSNVVILLQAKLC